MLRNIQETIEKHKMIEKGDRIIVGVSGGPDSVCLLHVLWSLKAVLGISLVAVHLDHEYRGEAARQDACYVKELCEKLEVPFYCFSENIEGMAKERGLSFEEMGRERRYALFFKVLEETKGTKIAVAQNQNDQVETILMRMMRGTGMDGLCGIPYKREDGVVRPLLDTDRKSIEAYCKERDLKPRQDATNLENVYTRNRIRLDLIPYIEAHFNSNFRRTLLRNIETVRDDVAYLNQMTEQVFHQTVTIKSKGSWVLDGPTFLKLHSALQKRLIRYIVNAFKGDRLDLSVKQVQQIVSMIHNRQTSKKHILPNGMTFKINYNEIDITDGSKEKLPGQWQYTIGLDERVEIPEANMCVSMTEVAADEEPKVKGGPNWTLVDGDLLAKELILRNRQPGDRFTPMGMQGTKKVKDYLMDKKVDRQIRDFIPLLCNGEQIVWILGYQIDNHYRLTQKTKTYRKIEFEILKNS